MSQFVKQAPKKELKKSNYFPLPTFFKFTALNKEALLKKAQENNEKLKENPDNKPLIVYDIEMKRLESLVDFIADP